MGNNLSGAIPSTTTAGIDSYLDELQGLTYKKSLGNARFLKTVKGGSSTGPVVIKILVKPSPTVSFVKHVNALKEEQNALREVPNAFPYQWQLETDRAVYVVRQFFHSSLYDRISTRPFLTTIEKKFITFQLLKCLADAHQKKVYHGDIKTENVMVTSWNWVYLSDFSSFKPTYLPDDNPSDFNFFFDTSSRRSCYLAPERFFSPSEDKNIKEDSLKPEMDVFSLGCVIVELFVESAPTFSFSQLLSYKRNEFDLEPHLNLIECHHIRSLVRSMLILDPKKRLSAEQCLNQWRNKAFPSYFYTFLYPYLTGLIDPDPNIDNFNDYHNPIELQTDFRVSKIASDFHQISALLGFNKYHNYNADLNNNELDNDNKENENTLNEEVENITEDGAIILSSVLTSSLRNCVYASKRILTLSLILRLSYQLSDEMKLDRILPYLISLIHDYEPIVRAYTIKIMVQLLDSIKEVSPINKRVFSEYILPNLKRLTLDQTVLVRLTYAKYIGKLANIADQFLWWKETDEIGVQYQQQNENQLLELQNGLLEQVITLLIDPDSNVKRALLPSILPLSKVFGIQKTSDFLLSHMITYLNDKDWMLRSAFFESIVEIGYFVGKRSLEEYILPLMIQAITDSEEFVVERVLNSLTQLSQLDLFSKITLWDLIQIVTPLLGHPNIWLRYGAIAFTCSASNLLSEVDKLCILNQAIQPFLKYYPILDHSIFNLTQALSNPVSRKIYNEMLSLGNLPNTFWELLQSESQQNSMKSEPSKFDKEVLNRLKTLGATQLDFIRLFAMKDYLVKVQRVMDSSKLIGAGTMGNRMGGLLDWRNETTIHLRSLGVNLRTEFFSAPQFNGSLNEKDVHYNDLDDKVYHRLSLINHEQDNNNLNNNNNINGSPINITDHRRTLNPPCSPTKAKPRMSTSSTLVLTKTDSNSSTNTLDSNRLNYYNENNNNNLIIELNINALDSIKNKKKGVKWNMYNLDFMQLPNQSLQNLLLKKGMEFFPKPWLGLGNIILSSPATLTSKELQRGYQRLETQSTPVDRWEPKGNIVAQINEHKGAIVSILSSPDHRFFITGSEDGTVKVWDTLRLLHNISNRSRLTYFHLGGKVTAMASIKDSYCFAVANDKGMIHILRVEMSLNQEINQSNKFTFQGPNYHQILCIQKLSIKNEKIICMQYTGNDINSWLIFVTDLNRVICWDLRKNLKVFSFINDKSYGPVTSLLIDQSNHYLILGTMKGIVTLYDMRLNLQLPEASFKLPNQCSINLMIQHNSTQIWILSGKNNELGLWDLSTLECKRVVMASSPTVVKLSEVSLKPMQVGNSQELLQASFDQLQLANAFPTPTNSSNNSSSSLNSLLSFALITPTSFLTSGTDQILRYIDLMQPLQSKRILPSEPKATYKSIEHDSVPVLFEAGVQQLPKGKPVRLSRALMTESKHRDAITGIIVLEYPARIVVSVDRAGAIKALF